jgi:hypothetical protein
MRRIVELSNAMTTVISNTVKRKKLRFMLALKSTERIATIIIQNEIEAIRGLIEQTSKDGEAICTICILVMFNVMFIVIFKLRSYILSFYTMCFY